MYLVDKDMLEVIVGNWCVFIYVGEEQIILLLFELNYGVKRRVNVKVRFEVLEFRVI